MQNLELLSILLIGLFLLVGVFDLVAVVFFDAELDYEKREKLNKFYAVTLFGGLVTGLITEFSGSG